VSDNISFLSDAARALLAVIEEAGPLVRALEERGDGGLATSYLSALDGADLDFIAEEIPDAFEQTQEGIERVAEIVRAMKEFAHPGSDEKASIDINRCIETTVRVAKNEWRYVADVNLDLDQGLPRVPALTGPFNQTLLILIVNAAQALGEMEHRGPTGKGTITISTRAEGDNAVVRVADNGPGIPPSVVEQIFDPFFTTKDVGKGSGQGLSIAHSVIFERHNGTIYVESEPGEGATFVIELPLLADYADAGRTKA
jgi:signal transduction histidine kinase